MKEITTQITEYEQTIQEKLEVLKNKINEIVQWINKIGKNGQTKSKTNI